MTRMTRRVAALCLPGILVAVLLGFGISTAGPAAAQEATPTATPVTTGNIPVVAISPSICFMLAGLKSPVVASQCLDWETPSAVESIDALGNGDGILQPSDMAGIDLDGNQVHQLDNDTSIYSGSLYIVAFVTNQAPVTFRTNSGGFWFQQGGVNDIAEGQVYTCDTAAEDPDCEPGAPGADGVVVARLRAQTTTDTTYAPIGPGTVTITQTPPDQATLAFRVVGEPRSLSFTTLESKIQDGITSAANCPLPLDANGFLGANGTAEKSIVLAIAKDIDGNPVTGGLVSWSVSDTNMARMATSFTPTIDLGAFGFGAPNIICGNSTVGTVTVTAKLGRDITVTSPVTANVDPNAVPAVAHTDFTVVGVPASMTLAADPTTLTCDGTATSKVTATIVDTAGNPIAAGNVVNFSVQTLGSANPVNPKTDDKGTASSVITPLSGGESGVPVVVTAGNVTQSILVSCANAAPATATPGTGTTPPGGGGTGGTGITGPNTGTGDGTVAGGSNWILFAALSALGLLAGSAMVWTGARARRR